MLDNAASLRHANTELQQQLDAPTAELTEALIRQAATVETCARRALSASRFHPRCSPPPTG
jgi:hypothetical protein